ncbi:hypothetical protein DY000_02049618 [Brassica cretica]|uniref:F-box associated domain-containing protein n=1 Tax=Brassica cretica TaxID=69181 RepID=A0ABQ7F6J6_BRACR|nr:hypothetical protein DY000_02049618 [Brassica cretica]
MFSSTFSSTFSSGLGRSRLFSIGWFGIRTVLIREQPWIIQVGMVPPPRTRIIGTVSLFQSSQLLGYCIHSGRYSNGWTEVQELGLDRTDGRLWSG